MAECLLVWIFFDKEGKSKGLFNPIEGFWCYLKSYVRRNNDQNFSAFLPLINTSIQKHQGSGIHVKLWKRFWDCIEMYKSGSTDQDVLQSLFGA